MLESDHATGARIDPQAAVPPSATPVPQPPTVSSACADLPNLSPATMVVLVGAGLFVYLRLRIDLDEGVDASLHTRAAAIATNAIWTTG